MNILVFNCGSSSLKFRLIGFPDETECLGGEAQRVGPPTAEPSRIVYRINGSEKVQQIPMRNHHEAFEAVMNLIKTLGNNHIDAVGHRVVHGGNLFSKSSIMHTESIQQLAEISHLAPIHNPPAVKLIKACAERYPRLPQVAVFDTAYHSTIPESAYRYALPDSLYKEEGVRKYGFHGTSHRYVVEEAASFLGKAVDEINGVSCHLGSGGASLCAVQNGCSIDNTMGYSPLQGLVMSTRCGDIDPAIVLNLISEKMGDADLVESQLNKQSGVLGMSGISADIRDVFSRINAPDKKDCRLEAAAGVYLWRIRKYLGAYLFLVEHPEVIIFTDTIGELEPSIRWAVCSNLECFGLQLDYDVNKSQHGFPSLISHPSSKIKALVIATNEELAIARQTVEAVNEQAA